MGTSSDKEKHREWLNCLVKTAMDSQDQSGIDPEMTQVLSKELTKSVFRETFGISTENGQTWLACSSPSWPSPSFCCGYRHNYWRPSGPFITQGANPTRCEWKEREEGMSLVAVLNFLSCTRGCNVKTSCFFKRCFDSFFLRSRVLCDCCDPRFI